MVMVCIIQTKNENHQNREVVMKYFRLVLLAAFICCAPLFSYMCPEDSESTAGSSHKVPPKVSNMALLVFAGATAYWTYKSTRPVIA